MNQHRNADRGALRSSEYVLGIELKRIHSQVANAQTFVWMRTFCTQRKNIDPKLVCMSNLDNFWGDLTKGRPSIVNYSEIMSMPKSGDIVLGLDTDCVSMDF